MRRCIITAVFAAPAVVGTTSPAVSLSSASTAAPSGGSRHCPDSHVLVDSSPVTENGRRLGVAKHSSRSAATPASSVPDARPAPLPS
jgi:hypothetical protein